MKRAAKAVAVLADPSEENGHRQRIGHRPSKTRFPFDMKPNMAHRVDTKTSLQTNQVTDMHAIGPLSARELRTSRTIADSYVGLDYWEDETVRRYRGLGLVFAEAERVCLTAAGMQAILSDGRSLLKVA
jgi:hypothetical protein